MFNPLPHPNDPPQRKPISARYSCPVAALYCYLPHGAQYTLTSHPDELSKVKGHEQADERTLAEEQGTVVIWLTNEQWDSLAAAHRTGEEQAHGGKEAA